MTEKRKNSDARKGVSVVLLITFLLAGIYLGMSWQDFMNDDAPTGTVDVSGEWVGSTTQDYATDEHGDTSRYDYRIVIEQKNGEITGMSYLNMIEHNLYAEERIEGYVDGTTVVYSEVETLILDNYSQDNWCLTQTTVSYQVIDGQETLVGDWEYVGTEERCQGITGRVILTRQPE